MASARYIIGIDLGTTNTAVAFVDTRSAEQRVEIFEVPQLVAPGQLAARRQLPSFIYMASEHDLSPAQTALPWSVDERAVVGELARSQGARISSRMISSAKSWLCHAGVNRHAAILPWGVEDTPKLSPVRASALVLEHVKRSWDHARASQGGSFVDQEIMVTVPASFDEAARELTLAAAQMAGYPPVVLLEEPQAAFYAWIDAHPAGSRTGILGAGHRVLVFDIGGGTTDFTLISVGADGDTFERTAVGDHLLLGGDNIDLSLAKQVELRLKERTGRKLDPLEWHGLVHSCRLAKETLLSDETQSAVSIAVAGRGSKLIGRSVVDEVARSELDEMIFDGFFPLVDAGELPQRQRAGLKEYGLPYAADPAVTRHLASFLLRHEVGQVNAVLFNGGAMTPDALRRRVIEQIAGWQAGSAPRELSNDAPELAVAKGAAYYGLVRRGLGSRIRGGTPRAFYIGVGAARGEDAAGEMAVCLAPKGLDEGSAVGLARDFELVCNRPVSFKLFSSTSRDDEPGAIVPVGDGTPDTTEDDSDLLELPPIVTVLRAPGRAHATVRLEVRITELGALEIWCHDQGQEHGPTRERWRLAFDMRGGGSSRRREETLPPGEHDPKLRGAQRLVIDVFRGDSPIKPPGLIKEIERVLEARRDEWSIIATRALFDAALKVEELRKKSPDHETRWLHLCGFCLRPGTGAPLDEWRIRQMWRIFNDNIIHPKHEACRLAWWITWRRIAGGMTKGQQEQLFDRLGQLFLPSMKQKKKWHEAKPTKEEAAEMLRTLAHLERLDESSKIKLGDELARRLEDAKGRGEPLYFWALGRIGARMPLYGPLNAVVPSHRATTWLEQLLEVDWPDPEKAAFPMAQLGRRTGDRARDIGPDLRVRLSERLRATPGGDRTARLVDEVVALEAREEQVALGDTLPPGLRLVPADQ